MPGGNNTERTAATRRRQIQIGGTGGLEVMTGNPVEKERKQTNKQTNK